MTEANWFGPSPADTPLIMKRPDRTPAEVEQTRIFDTLGHVAGEPMKRPISDPLNLRPCHERGLIRSLLRRLAGDV